MLMRSIKAVQLMLIAGLLCTSAQDLSAQSQQPAQSNEKPPTPGTLAPATAPHTRYRPRPMAKGAREYYALMWGVDSLSVKSVESGEIIRFTYSIIDANKAKVLNDKKVVIGNFRAEGVVEKDLVQLRHGRAPGRFGSRE